MSNQHNSPLIGQAFLGVKILGASASLSGTDSGKVFSNSGATSAFTITLPQALPGRTFQFLVAAAYVMTLQPTATDNVRGLTAGAPYTFPNTVGYMYGMQCVVQGTWETIYQITTGQVPTFALGAGTATSATFLRGDGTWTNVLAGGLTVSSSSGLAVTSPAGVQANFLTMQQTGYASWEWYSPANTSDLYLYNSGVGNYLKLAGGGTQILQYLNANNYAASQNSVAGIALSNTSTTSQTCVEFQSGSGYFSRIRADYVSNLSYSVSSASAAHYFYVGGDSGSGVSEMAVGGSGVVVGNPTGGAKGAGTINCTGLYVNGVAVTVP